MAGDEELLSVDDKDVFAAALSDNPPAEQPEKPSEEPKPEGDRPRDEQGRFLPKAADAETTKPEPQVAEPTKAEPDEAKASPEDAIPSWRLREVSQARREEAQARQAAEERSRVLEAQLAQLLRHQARQQQQPEKLPDLIEQPETAALASQEEALASEKIPSWRLREVAQARREEAQARQAAEERSRVLEAQLRQLLQQQQRQQQQEPELPDFIEQPKEFAQAIQERARQEIEQFRLYMEQREIKRSLERADHTHGEEFREAYIAFNSPAFKDDERLLEQIRNSYDQGEAILAWHRQQKALSEIGDPKTYRQKLKAELLADPEFRKEFGEALRGQAARQPSSVTSLPNLARAPGSASGPRDDWPTTDAEIFAEVTRRRA